MLKILIAINDYTQEAAVSVQGDATGNLTQAKSYDLNSPGGRDDLRADIAITVAEGVRAALLAAELRQIREAINDRANDRHTMRKVKDALGIE